MPPHIKNSFFFSFCDCEKYTISSGELFLFLVISPEEAEMVKLYFSPHLFTTYFTPVERGGLSWENLQKKLNQDRVSSTFSCRKSKPGHVHFVEKPFSSHIKLSISI